MWEYTPPPRIGVIQHSAKGTTWTKKNAKYLKKVGNKYYYTSDEARTNITGEADLLSKYGSKILKGKGKTGSSSSAKKSGSGGKGSKAKAEKEPKAKKEKVEKEKKLTEKKVKRADAKTGIKTTISKYIQVGQNDSIYATALEDGQWTVEVEFENGDVQTFTLDADYNLVSKSDKKKK